MKQRLSNRLKLFLKEAHIPDRPSYLGNRSLGDLKRRTGAMQSVPNQDLGNLKRRTGAMKAVANQDMKDGARYDTSNQLKDKGIVEEAIKKVKAKVETEKQRQTGKTDTGSKPEKVETELVHHPLVGPT